MELEQSEALLADIVRYIGSKHFFVQPKERSLLIYKSVNGELFSKAWMITVNSLQYSRSNSMSLLKPDADRYMQEIDDMILQRIREGWMKRESECE